MNAKTLSHAINEFIGGVSQILQWSRVEQVWHATPHVPVAPGSPAEADLFGKMKLIHDRQMDAHELVAKTGRRLALLLVRAGHDATSVLKVVYFIAEGGGPDRVSPIWPDIRAALQTIAIQPQRARASGRSAPARRRRKASMSLAEADCRASKYLDEHGWPSKGGLRKIATHIGCSHELVRQCPKVKEVMATLQPAPKGERKAPPLDSIPSNDPDPLNRLALREELAALGQKLPPEQREEFERADPERRVAILDAWQSQQSDASEDARPRSTRRRPRV